MQRTVRSLILLILWITASWAQEMAVPVAVQYPLFLKVLVFL